MTQQSNKRGPGQLIDKLLHGLHFEFVEISACAETVPSIRIDSLAGLRGEYPAGVLSSHISVDRRTAYLPVSIDVLRTGTRIDLLS